MFQVPYILRRLLFQFLLFLTVLAFAQKSSTGTGVVVQRFTYKLGDNRVVVKKTTFPPIARHFIVLLHDNENTAEKAALAFLKQHGGTLLSIENENKRLIRFSIRNRSYRFDPNRIFTAKGLRQNLTLFGSYTPVGAKAVAGFRSFILNLMPRAGALVAVHNNTEGMYSIHSYKNPKELKQQAYLVHINPAQDSDHFFVTTAYGVFKKMKQEGYNVVLQHRQSAADDGSLSFYCIRQGRRYINVEAQAGAFTTQLHMLQALRQMIKGNIAE
jgi:hypothetical protein